MAVDVLVTAPTGTPLGAVTSGLADALAAAGSDTGGGTVPVYSGADRLDPQRCALGEPPLVDGAVVSLGAPAGPHAWSGDPAAEAAAGIRLHVVAGPDAGGVHLLHGGQVRIGRSTDAEVPLDDPDVSRLHCAVTVAEDGRVTVADLGSTNGTALEGRRVGADPVPLAPGALLRIGESALRLRTPAAGEPSGPGTAPDGEGHLRVAAAAHENADDTGDAGPGAYRGNGPGRGPGAPGHGRGAPAHGNPLSAAPRPGGRPPGAPGGSGGTVPVPPPGVGPQTFEVVYGAGAADGEPAAAPQRRRGIGAWARRITGGRTADGRPAGDGDPAAADEEELRARATAEAAAMQRRWPDPADILMTALAPGHRLWERGPGHPDALTVRLGAADRVAPGGAVVPAAPVTVDLRRTGALGLAGPRARLSGLTRSVIAQLAALHSPAALEIVLISTDRARSNQERLAEWSWLGWLPQLHPAHGQDCRLLLAYDREQAAARAAELVRRLDAGEALGPAWSTAPPEAVDAAARGYSGPYTVVVVDGDPGSPALRDTFARLAAGGAAGGVHLVCLAEVESLPAGAPVAAGHARACAVSPVFAECGTVALLSGDVATGLRLLRPARAQRGGSAPAGGPRHGPGEHPASATTATTGSGAWARAAGPHPGPAADGDRDAAPSDPYRGGGAGGPQDGGARPGGPAGAAGPEQHPHHTPGAATTSGTGAAAYPVAGPGTPPHPAGTDRYRPAVPGPTRHPSAPAGPGGPAPAAGPPRHPAHDTGAAGGDRHPGQPDGAGPHTPHRAPAAGRGGDPWGGHGPADADTRHAQPVVPGRPRPGAGRPSGPAEVFEGVATVDAVSAAWAERFARALAPLRPSGSGRGTGTGRGAAAPPAAARLLDELGLARATPASLMARWAAAADEVPAGGRTLAVLGAGSDGPISVDLAADGPHLLIDGATGTGKTELLRSVAASLAAAERPDRLGLVLVDGGGSDRGEGLRVCTDLPHVTTYLAASDPVRMREFAQALSSELKRRAELLGQLDFVTWHTQQEAGPRVVAPRRPGDARTGADPAGPARPARAGAPGVRSVAAALDAPPRSPADAPAPAGARPPHAPPPGETAPASPGTDPGRPAGTGSGAAPPEPAPGGEQGRRGDLDPAPSGTLKLRTTAQRSGEAGGERLTARTALPRLVVLVDDFDALVAPALGSPGRPAAGSVVRALDAVARDGARLGVHLVAASGRPDRTADTAAVERAGLWITLESQPPSTGGAGGGENGPGDGGAPDAGRAAAGETVPGRGRLYRPDDGVVTPFQAGRVTGRIPRTATQRPTVVPLDWARMGDPPTRRPLRELGNGPTDLALLASALQRAAQSAEAATIPALV
ncbi:FtsK/SpoIIIE domain-containing protein [Streptomyces sp. NPDC018031]|uniref:FtsK/SpoIIIE domain-containing protein n=1 Tax=Streptomyces sp. NPDC018031 TaxID=3365033 RepID=UPI0037A85934